jgi:hypothetical protein
MPLPASVLSEFRRSSRAHHVGVLLGQRGLKHTESGPTYFSRKEIDAMGQEGASLQAALAAVTRQDEKTTGIMVFPQVRPGIRQLRLAFLSYAEKTGLGILGTGAPPRESTGSQELTTGP